MEIFLNQETFQECTHRYHIPQEKGDKEKHHRTQTHPTHPSRQRELVEEEQVAELEKLGIKRVLNMAVNCDDDLWIQRFGRSGYLKVGLRDHVDQDLQDSLNEAIKFIASSKTPIYVHCQAGKSRSVATVIGYLIQEHQWPLKRAYDHVVERRRCMSPNIGFVSQLILLEKRILGSDKANGLVSVGNSDDLDPSSRTTVVPWMTS
ncbi:hypothetical protein BG015_001841 [Linnemannia schmuckeri]|uniref:protein-tyrosine-phosphatase n=1 Tax=Linnemannia schmuckeri TaxID=64567 RepID=A0A9P5V6J6_9FUNG|nr:hypothetical protein BG015_001841 [Linnemannia schmuckeri]